MGECFSAILDWADVRSDFEVDDFVMSLQRVCLRVSLPRDAILKIGDVQP